MAHTRSWDETDPADTDDYGDGAKEIREMKSDIQERLNVDHYFLTTGDSEDCAEHRQISFYGQIADPANAADKGFLYIKDASGKVELFFMDEDGNAVQLTSVGSVKDAIPSGSVMLFYADAAPTGWTLVTSVDDKLVFVTKSSGEGGEEGGTTHSTGTWTQPEHTLTEAEIPEHYHWCAKNTSADNYLDGTETIAANGSHGNDYNLNGSALEADVGKSSSVGSGDAHSHGSTWRPASACFIMATKD